MSQFVDNEIINGNFLWQKFKTYDTHQLYQHVNGPKDNYVIKYFGDPTAIWNSLLKSLPKAFFKYRETRKLSRRIAYWKISFSISIK